MTLNDQETLEAHQRVRTVLASRPPVDARLGFDQRVMSMLTRETSWFEHWNWRALTWGLTPVAAALLIAALSIVTKATPAVTGSSGTSAVSVLPANSSDTVATAIGSDGVSDVTVLSLMLYANADDPMSAHPIKK